MALTTSTDVIATNRFAIIHPYLIQLFRNLPDSGEFNITVVFHAGNISCIRSEVVNFKLVLNCNVKELNIEDLSGSPNLEKITIDFQTVLLSAPIYGSLTMSAHTVNGEIVRIEQGRSVSKKVYSDCTLNNGSAI